MILESKEKEEVLDPILEHHVVYDVDLDPAGVVKLELLLFVEVRLH